MDCEYLISVWKNITNISAQGKGLVMLKSLNLFSYLLIYFALKNEKLMKLHGGRSNQKLRIWC